ncbi:hypothetical protein IW261DRAFT_1431207 [Armillaria novae-zelandiae]|uniref:Uncharacterized protein n=1 Tax=Armillaria novae-zelandiae TaxID=153914 RepID=A0AA39URY5_9AGAR|nr:hypothetical protein IW261DRAFT_1431207 [Armillaria novae-zelandiae]
MHFFLLHLVVACFQSGSGDLLLNDFSIGRFISKIWTILWHIWGATLGCHRRKNSHGTYANEREEQAYWESAMRWNLCLQTSGAMKDWSIPVITSYTPAPPAPASQESETEATEYYLPPKAFCKWYRMVFPESPVRRVDSALLDISDSITQHYPTLSQAQRLKTRFSSLDRREMHRISRILSDEVVFGTHRRWGSEYRTMWKLWIERKGTDMTIVFVNQSQ